MKIIYHGFDGLEFTIKSIIPRELSDRLSDLQDAARKSDGPEVLKFGTDWMHVHQTGARGGYTFRCSHGRTGTWFFKKPNITDPWGIRFSAASHALATLGLEGLRQACATFLKALNIDIDESSYAPSRADFAVDFILPDFEPDPNQFVMHSHTGRRTISDIEVIDCFAQSNQNTSVTVGKMPRRQVIIYNKSKEAMVKNKVEWPLIWQKSLGDEAALLVGATVWRVELRVAKRHLKDVWHVGSWAAFYQMLPRILNGLLKDIRYCEPSEDSNRSRWPTHEIWKSVSDVVDNSLFTYVPTLLPEEYVEVTIEQKIDELHLQIIGLLISTAGIIGIQKKQFRRHVAETTNYLVLQALLGEKPLQERLAQAGHRYLYLV